jgi:hypothetical protein
VPYKNPCKRKQARKKHRQHIKDEINKRLTPCAHCGAFDVAFMDWHHTDPSTKVASVNRLKRDSTLEAALAEIEKCICLCSNCHRKLHY